MKITIACALCALLSTPAIALDTDAVLQRLEAALNVNNMNLIGGEVTSEGNNIIVKNFGVEAGAVEGLENLTLRLDNVTEEADGAFIIEKLSVDEVSFEIAGDRAEIHGFEMEQVYLPIEAAPSYTLAYLPYKSIGVNGFTFYKEDKTVIKGGRTYTDFSDFEAGKQIRQQGVVENISVSLDNLGKDAEQSLKDLGYEILNLKSEFVASIDFDRGIFNFENIDFQLENIGTLSLKMQFGGYSLDIAKAFSEISEKAGDDQALGLAMLGLAQQLTFNSVSIRFDDHSITDKVLDYAAEKMESSRQEVVTTASAMTQFGLGNLQYPDFALKVSQAVDAYLNAPKSIEVTATPAQPVPFMMLAGAAQNPKALIDMLAVEIKANQ